MPIDGEIFKRGGEDLKVLVDSQAARFDTTVVDITQFVEGAEKKLNLVDAYAEVDKFYRSTQYSAEQGRAALSKVNKEVAEKKKAGENADDIIAKIPQIKEQNAKLEALLPSLIAFRNSILGQMGNLVHPSVPVFQSEDYNAVLRTHGPTPMRSTNLHHHELLEMIDGYEAARGVNIAGHRGYFLKGYGCMLNQALIQHGLSFLRKKKYVNLQPPFFMKKDAMAATAQLSQFDEELYKVSGDGEDMYLIATSEQPISALYKGETLVPEELPKYFAGISTCFRKEAGSHGKDAWGIFRVHQFEKVEQFVLCAPEDSWRIHEEMAATSEEFLKSLGLSYRVINIVSGALNNAAAKKYDIEAWFPTLGVYRELVSCSNCTDYQARAMDTKFGFKKQVADAKQYVHMLNGTLTATERTICCLLENYQTEKGIIVPEVLRKYMDDIDFIPFVKPKPAHQAGVGGAEKKAAKQAQKQAGAK